MAVMAIDQGTTGTTTVIVDESGHIKAKAYQEFAQRYPHPGWVEQDPLEVLETVTSTIKQALQQCPEPIDGIGITNQRETTLIWDRFTGKPVYAAIGWQCRRTAELCEQYRPHAELIRQKTGLPLDAYFSATKIRWIMDHVGLKAEDNLCFGTIDSWLIWNLTQGSVHATDLTNASRTLLFNIDTKQWDEELCALFGVPMGWLPEVRPSISDFGPITSLPELAGVMIKAVAGDQQAALYGQGCWAEGQVKNTYGTGAFMVMNTGQQRINSRHGLITTLGVGPDGEPCYALEGSVFVAGAAIQWLRDDLCVLESAVESEAISTSVPDTGGVYFVPAFVGLGAPYWDMAARGGILGLTRGSKRAHIIRAAVEAMAYQTFDVLAAMEADSGLHVKQLAVDGGATANNFLMQFQADILQRPVVRPQNIERTSLGVAMMAGGYKNAELLNGQTFSPIMDEATRVSRVAGWHDAVSQITGVK